MATDSWFEQTQSDGIPFLLNITEECKSVRIFFKKPTKKAHRRFLPECRQNRSMQHVSAHKIP